MSVLVKGMEMPTNCDNCWALDDYGDYPRCRITEEQRGYNFPIREKRMDNCPLVEIPPHGRLIDADEFIAEQRHLYCENCKRRKGMKNGKVKFVYDIGDVPCRSCGYGDVLEDMDDAPTIIESTIGQVFSDEAVNEAEEGE